MIRWVRNNFFHIEELIVYLFKYFVKNSLRKTLFAKALRRKERLSVVREVGH